MILHRLSLVLSRFGAKRHARYAAADHVMVWREAARHVPGLIPDLIRQAQILSAEPVRMKDGQPMGMQIDPYRLAYEAGRRDLALQLIAAAGMTETDMENMLKEQDYEQNA